MKKKALVKVRRSSAGLGLFAAEDIKKGALVIEYTGEKITTEEGDRRGGQYLFTLNEDFIIDGKGRENTARYINHSCRPNCEAEIDETRGVTNAKIYIYARRNIKLGEELNYDYGKEFWNEHIKPYGCRCEKCTEARVKPTKK